MHKGSCLCGAVTFEVTGDLQPPDGCHCTQCRKSSGHFFVSTDVPRGAVTIRGGGHITWFQSSDKVRRGFCAICGAPLFWDPIHKDWIGLAMGAFETPTGVRMAIHVHVSDKGDYYDLTDGLPQKL
jgi:hypothetical protein